MTTLGKVSRKTRVEYKGRTLVVDLYPKYMTVREAKRPLQTGVNISYDVIYELGLKKRFQEGQ